MSFSEDNVRSLGFSRLPLPNRPEADLLVSLRELLLGQGSAVRELPALPDLVAGVIALASGSRHRVLLPLGGAAAEFALVRRGSRVLLDCYGTESQPEIFARERELSLPVLLTACREICAKAAQFGANPTTVQVVRELGRRVSAARLAPDPHAQLTPVRTTGGSLDSPGTHVPLAFGFSAEIYPSVEASAQTHAFADVHALLLQGTLWAFAGQKRMLVFEGPIMLAAQRMVAAVRALCEAWQADRNVHVRLRSGAFWVAVRRERGGKASLTLSGGKGTEALTWPALEIDELALPILRLSSDLIRKLIAADRRQTHNLRLSTLRNEIRTLRRMARTRDQRQSFENDDPERLRLSTPDATPTLPASGKTTLQPAMLRYSQRWSAEIDGLDANSVNLRGDRLVIATQKLLLALSRSSGEVLWSQPNAGATVVMAGRSLLRVLPEGGVELCDAEDGSVYARAPITPRIGAEGAVVFAGGGDLPPVAIVAEARQHVVAIDLRTGQPRWGLRAHGPGPLQFTRSGRVLIVTSGDGTVDAVDVASGEVVWRFGQGVRFGLKPTVCREVVVAGAGEPRGAAGVVYGLELYSGRLLWERELCAAPSADAIDTGTQVLVPHGRSKSARLSALDPRSGAVHWEETDPGLDNGGKALSLDHALIVNTASGRTLALDLKTGRTLWTRVLSNPLTDDVPRQLDPILRQGALFVPSAQVHVLRPQDGTPLCQPSCDLVPDCLRVDDRGSFYVAEESGHIRAYAAAPHLSLVK